MWRECRIFAQISNKDATNMSQSHHYYIAGAGAAGMFLAIALKALHPELHVAVLERSARPLTKVRATGGGRCNVTNTFETLTTADKAARGIFTADELSVVYPRGARMMQKLLRTFPPQQLWEWWEHRGVPLKVEDEGRVFPRSNTSETIVDCLIREAERSGVELLLHTSLEDFAPLAEGGFVLTLRHKGEVRKEHCDALAITTGGAPKREGYAALQAVGHTMIAPCPSLFNFKVVDKGLNALSGITIDPVLLTLAGTKVRTAGSLLLTHQGFSGPAALRLSAHAARTLAERDYRGEVLVSWLGTADFDAAVELLKTLQRDNAAKTLATVRPPLPQRLWMHLLQRAELPQERRWSELGKKNFHRLATLLTADSYAISGRGTHKDEFVTCGGVPLTEVDGRTMESRKVKGLFFAGEVLDIDALTGGYNLTAAWITAAAAANAPLFS